MSDIKVTRVKPVEVWWSTGSETPVQVFPPSSTGIKRLSVEEMREIFPDTVD